MQNEKIDYTGTKFNKLTFLREGGGLYSGKEKRRSGIFKCDCGNEKELIIHYVKRQKVKSCGCLNGGESKLKVNPGDVFTHWTVLEESEGYFRNGKKSDRTFLCRCVCGKEKDVNLQSLNKGESKSCGCRGILREEKIKK